MAACAKRRQLDLAERDPRRDAEMPCLRGAYVALFTGCGVSLAAAGAVRWLVMIACIVSLAYLTVKVLRGVIGRESARS